MITKRERRLEYQRGHTERSRAVVRKEIDAAKSVPCKDCGGTFPTYCMDFDHVRGVKILNIGAATGTWASNLPKLREEIAKCDIVCSNCHRIRTHGTGVRTWRTETKKKLRERVAEKARERAEGKPPKEPKAPQPEKESVPKWQRKVLPKWD